jgi:predicted metal-dependent hydrolase
VTPPPVTALPPHTVRRSPRARHARLTITRDGELVVVLPRRAPDRAAALLVAEHLDWVHAQLGRMAATRARLDGRPALTDGRTLTVNGIPCSIRLAAPGTRPPAGVRAGTAHVERRLASDEEGLVGELLIFPGRGGRPPAAILEAWLRSEAGAVLAAQVAAHAPAMGVTPGRITVRAQATRWGSASRDGSLSFNWRLLLAPPFALDAVVVHELAHLRIRGHGPRFWALVRQHAPRTDEARAWLRAHHAELMAALD